MMSSSLLGSSYYVLYSSNKDNKQNESSTTTIQTSTASSQHSFWQEFQWSSNEKQSIVELLQQNEDKCDIIENSITPQRGQFIIDKYEKDAQLHWNNFYSSHETNFFKDRHYLHKAFPDDFGILYQNNIGNGDDYQKERRIVVNSMSESFTITEIGCGVGNTVLPLLELDPFVYIKKSSSSDNSDHDNVANIYEKKELFIWGLDFSSVAIELLKKDTRYINATTETNDRARAQVWDITTTHPKDIYASKVVSSTTSQSKEVLQCLESSSNISLLLFVLSAISPDRMMQAAKNVASTLKPGGILVLRDYGRYDEAQIKLGTSRNKRLSDNFYVKHDGTRCYYFTTEDIDRLFGQKKKSDCNEEEYEGAGLEVLQLKYVQRLYKNRADDATRRRVWVQARFRNPL